MNLYLFPISFALNSFSLSLLVVMAGLFGHHSMAADLSLAQAAMIALFFSLSANARNLILKSSDGRIGKSIAQMRLLSAPVLAVAAFAVSIYLSKVSLLLSLAIVIRQLSEWFSEIELARMEKAAEYGQAKIFFTSFALPLLFVAGALLFVPSFFLPALYLWAGLPLLLCAGGITKSIATLSTIPIEWRKILPNYGSTFIIGVVVFFSRLLIAGFAGKEVAGQLFTAFALGSIVGSLYERTIGPSFKVSADLAKTRSLFFRLSWALPVAGAALISAVYFFGETNSYLAKNIYLAGATGFSLVGGFIMLGAQAIKINILHSTTRDDVFMADLLSNFAILVSIPVAFLLVGEAAFVVLFLTNAIVVYAAYWLISGSPLVNYTSKREKMVHALVAFAIVMPLFLQLGSGVYRGGQEIYDWGGALSMLPLPLSVFLIFPLILLMHSFRGVKSFSVFTFFVFVMMMCGTMVSSAGDAMAVKDKLLLSLQYLLPFFGLVIAEHAGTSLFFLKRMGKVFLYVVMFVVGLQLVATFYSGEPRLQSYLYLFSIYNNLQYAVIIIVSAFLISLFTLYPLAGERRKLLFMCPVMCLYAVFSRSMPVIGLLVSGLLLFWAFNSFSRKIGLVLLLGGLMFGAGRVYVGNSGAPNTLQPAAALSAVVLKAAEPRQNQMHNAVAARLRMWGFYLRGIKSADTKTFLFGHPAVPQRNIYPSAQNYYLDTLYNFGFITLLPIFAFVIYTIRLTWVSRLEVLSQPQLLGLGFVVYFLIFMENFFKVGLRQPYSGIFTFVLWGLLVSKLRLARAERPGRVL